MSSEERVWRRIALALVAGADAVILGALVATIGTSSQSHPAAPAWLLWLGGCPLAVAPIALVAVGALTHFARRAGRWCSAAIALTTLAILCEAHAALVGGPMRIFFASGAALFGWTLGLFAARLRGADDDDAGAELVAETAAAGALAATYVGAAVSKLGASGISWADEDTLRALILAQRPVAEGSLFDAYARAVVHHGVLASALAGVTLVVQLAALAYPLAGIPRAIVGTSLLAFHVNVALLTPILFLQPMALLAAFSYPWPRWVRRIRGQSTPPEIAPEVGSGVRAGRVARRAMVPVGVMLVVALASPIRRYTAGHHAATSAVARPPAGPEVRALLDGLAEGDALGDLRVRAITGPAGGALEITASREGAALSLQVMRRGTSPRRPPASTARYDIFYTEGERAVSGQERGAAIAALRERLMRTEEAVDVPAGL